MNVSVYTKNIVVVVTMQFILTMFRAHKVSLKMSSKTEFFV